MMPRDRHTSNGSPWFTPAGAFGLVLLACAAMGIVIMHGRQESMKRGVGIEAEGREFGTTADQEGCVRKASIRLSSSSYGEKGLNHFFLKGCLRASRPTPRFCADVPDQGSQMAVASWEINACARIGHPQEMACSLMMTAITEFCSQSARGHD